VLIWSTIPAIFGLICAAAASVLCHRRAVDLVLCDGEVVFDADAMRRHCDERERFDGALERRAVQLRESILAGVKVAIATACAETSVKERKVALE
jgi:hypothetical protein